MELLSIVRSRCSTAAHPCIWNGETCSSISRKKMRSNGTSHEMTTKRYWKWTIRFQALQTQRSEEAVTPQAKPNVSDPNAASTTLAAYYFSINDIKHSALKNTVFVVYTLSAYFLKLSRIDCHPSRCSSSEFSFSISKTSVRFTPPSTSRKVTPTALPSSIV